MVLQKLEITPKALKLLNSGSLWIFSNEIKQKLKGLIPGSLVEFICQGKYVGVGYVNPHSLIAGRILSREPVTNWVEFFLACFKKADERRASLKARGSYRAVFSEADSLPGLIVDRYVRKNGHTVLVAQSTTAGMDQLREFWQGALLETFKPQGFVLRADSHIRHLEQVELFSEVILGDKPDLQNGELLEDGLYFAADFVDGQKSGFFLDQKENRLALRGLVGKDSEGVDLCSYSGAWGMNAFQGGARHVTFVDQSAEALELAQRTLKLNNISQNHAHFVAQDVFDFLRENKKKFDFVVADPPAFIKSKKNLNQGIRAYKNLNELSLKSLKAGGLLVSCSCSFHMAEADLETVLAESCSAQGKLGQVILRGRQSEDHPWVINRPESRYLKCYFLKLDEA